MAEQTQTVTIDGTEHNLADLSDNARGQLVNLRVTDEQIRHLQQQLAIVQTARTAYANELAKELPQKPAGKKPAAKKAAKASK